MTERKVATRQERYMFEQLIRQDMQNGIQRTISDNLRITPSNEGQARTPSTNNNNNNQNYPQIQNSNGQTPQNNENNNNMNKNKGIKRTLAQKFNIRTNKGKRDAVWEQKRQLKIAKYEQIMQEEQQNYEQKLSPKNTPNQQYQRVTPNNQQRMTPQQQYQQYQRGTPNNGVDPRMSPPQYQQNQRGSPNNGIDPRMTPQQYQQYQRGSPNNGNDPRMSPQQ